MSETVQVGVEQTTLKAAGSEYLVLQEHEPAIWLEVKTVKARSADDAIRKAVKEDEGRYVAVPARSWTPRTLKVEQTTRVRLD